MLFYPFFKIICTANIERTIGTLKDIGNVWHKYIVSLPLHCVQRQCLRRYYIAAEGSEESSILRSLGPKGGSDEELRDLDSNQDIGLQRALSYH